MSEELTWLPAWQIRELIGKGEVSPVEVVDHFLGRIEEFDPQLKAFAHVDHDGARRQAKEAEQAVRDGAELGPLHGLPTSVKEHIAVAGMPRMGSPLTGEAGGTAAYDDFGVERLRKAGAIIVGTNTMMGTGGGGGPGDGVPGVFMAFNWEKEARNPWDTTRVPGWSSSGGAASAVSRLLPFTIGSDGGGSTRLPAAYSGVVGVHPTTGLFTNVDYTAPAIPSGGTIGPLAREVRDAALVTHVMAGPDGRDPFCIQTDPPDYLASIDEGVDGMRVAWTDDFGFASVYASDDSARVIGVIRDAAFGLQSLGASVEPTDEVWDEPWAAQMQSAGAYMTMPGASRPDPEALRAGFEIRGRNWDRFRRLFRDHDLLLAPTAQRVARSVEEWNAAWTTDGHTYVGQNFAPTYTSHTSMFNWLKFPAISVPCGFVDGLPVGLQVIGWPGSEDRIFRLAQAFQRAFPQDARPPVS